MQRRRFGQMGSVSAVGFGGMSFGGFYGPTTEAESMRAMARAFDLGVDFWDTANVYGDGLSETLIGKFIREDLSRRAKIMLATKFAISRMPDGTRSLDISPEHLRESSGRLVEAARRRSRRSLLRPPDRPEDSDRGDDRRHRPFRDRARHAEARAIRSSNRCGAIPIFSLDAQQPRARPRQACEEAGALLVAFSPVGRGHLTGLLQEVEAFGEKDFRGGNPRFHDGARVLPVCRASRTRGPKDFDHQNHRNRLF